MSLLKHMVAGAEKATGDHIVLAGAFMRKGAELGELGGDIAGFAAGGLIGHGQEFNTAAVGGIAGRSAAEGGKPRAFVVALSDTKIYVLRTTASVRGISREKLELLHTFDRKKVHVTAKAKLLVRSLVIEDPKSGEKLELESERNWKAHGKDIVAALVADSLEEDDTEAGATPPD